VLRCGYRKRTTDRGKAEQQIGRGKLNDRETEQMPGAARPFGKAMRVLSLFLVGLFLVGAGLFAQLPASFDTHLAAGQAAVLQSRYAEADAQLRAAVEEASRLDPAPPRAADALAALCDLDLLMNRYDEAITLASRALTILEPATPTTPVATPDANAPTVPDLSPHLARLAGAYRAAGKTVLAVPSLERMLSIDMAALSANDAKVSADYDKLGSAYMELTRMDDARAAYRKALDTRISRLGPDHIEVATSWVNLGVLEDRNARPREAQADFETALAISEKSLGAESYALTGILDRLGRLFSAQKIYSKAEPMFQRSLAIREKALGAHHSDVAPALDNLGMVYFFDSKYVEAEPLFQRALQIWASTQGPTSPLAAQALDNLGALYAAQKRYSEAEPLFRKALAIRETRDIESLSNLALLYEATNDLKRADDYFQRAILVGEKGLGGDHVEVLDTIDEYVVLLRIAGRTADAKRMLAHRKELEGRYLPQKPIGQEAAEVKAAGHEGKTPAPVQK
jgi:tetratricopeptide (TPR) repeat protein